MSKTDDYTHLVRLARKATKGRWCAVGRQVENENDDLPDVCFVELGECREQDIANAEYIAAVQPRAVLAMIKKLRQYECKFKGEL